MAYRSRFAPARVVDGGILRWMLTIVVVVSACSPNGGSNPTAPPAQGTVESSPDASNEWLTDAELTRAISFRRKLGLRFDEAWVRFVGNAPEAQPGVAAYSIPMMPDEMRAFEGRARTTDEIIAVVERYGEAQPDAWAGAYADNAHGRVISLFSADVARHEAAMRQLLRPDAPLDVFETRWSLRDLERLQQKIKDDVDWIRAHDIYPLGFGVSKPTNSVFLDVSSARPDVAALLIEHFDAAGMLTVTSDGTGVRLLPTGALSGTVVDASGDPIDLTVEGFLIWLVADIPGVGPIDSGNTETGRPGGFLFPDIPAVRYEVQVFEEQGMVLVGTEQTFVRADQITDVKIVLEREY